MASTNLPAIGIWLRGFAMGCLCCVFTLILSVAVGWGNPLMATNKLSLATWGSYYQQDHMGPGTYAFGYDIEDPVTGNVQFKQEERHPNGTVTGNYGYVDAEGKPHVVTYIADENGYREKLEIEGEPVKFFPDVSAFPSNNLHQQQTNEADSGVSQVTNEIPLQGESRPLLPPTYGLIYSSYYNYLPPNGAFK